MSNFCPLPWIHQFIQPTGVKMCCSSPTELRVSPIEFKNSDYITQVKETIANEQIHPDCKSCFNAEAKGFNSTRLSALKDYAYTIDTVPDAIEYLDLRQSNLCNFSCRTCEPLFSSSIEREIKANDSIQKFYKTNAPFIHSNTLELIRDFLPTLNRVNFTGGEPLLNKENLDILEALDPDVKILITTNASVINPRISKLLARFSDVHWTISIDAVGAAAEYIRNGTDWPTVESNINTILNYRQSILFNTTLSAYSVFGIDDLAQWLVDCKQKYPHMEVMFSIASFPKHVQPTSIPVEYKHIALAKLDKAIEVFGHNESLISLKSMINSVILDTASSNQFVDYTQKLDHIRNQSFKDTLL